MDKQAAEIERLWKENGELHQKVSELMEMVNNLRQQLAAKTCECKTETSSQGISTLRSAQPETTIEHVLRPSSMAEDNVAHTILVSSGRNQEKVGSNTKTGKTELCQPHYPNPQFPHQYTHQQPRYQPLHQPSYQPPYQSPYQQPYQPLYQPYAINRCTAPATNFIASTPTFQPTQTPRPRPNTPTNYQRTYHPQAPRLPIDPLPAQYTYTQLLPQLVQQGLIQKSQYTTTSTAPGHNLNVRCEYHGGSTGHSTEECGKLKELVQKLINEGKVCLQKNT